MHAEHATYDPSSLSSILEYARQLEGMTLREACNLDDLEDPHARKGSFGNALEKYYFHYDINSSSKPDFEEVGAELKSTPLRRKKNGELSAKERLVISMINYMTVVDETWETSSLLKKLHKILLIAYEYDPDSNPVDYLVKLVDLWHVPESDVPIFKHDWDTVVDKVRAGKAHELSGSDTLYLEAATKSATSKNRTKQPYSSEPAKPRAWAIKSSYMTTVLNGMLDMQSIRRTRSERDFDLLTLVQKRFEPYIGMTEDELAEKYSLVTEGKRKPKNLCALITKLILGIKTRYKIEEFEKAGMKTKTIRLKRNGVPKESISFPVFDYFDVAEQPFEESEFYSQLRQKYLFVIYREDAAERGVYRLSEVLFWQMPDCDLSEAKRCYEEMQHRVRIGHADRSVTSRENRCCHVRPHGRNKNDTLPTPYGSMETKKCFWINARYIGEEIDRVNQEQFEATARAIRERIDRSNVAGQVIRIAELFAGVGGFRLGLEGYDNPQHPEFSLPPAGPFVTVWANQWEPQGSSKKQFAARCYEARFGKGSVVNEDIHRVLDAFEAGRIDIPDIDMVVGGFPCQDYSVARPLSQASGIEGKKGVLWWEIYRFLQLKDRPRYVLLENVDRLLSSPSFQRGRDFAIILSCLARLGYAVEWRVINGADYGFPQKRRRTYLFAEQTDEMWNLEERMVGGVMAEAFPVEQVGDAKELELYADPYENSELFGAGCKRSPFEHAGVMQGGCVRTARVSAVYDGERAVLGDVLVPEEEVPEAYYVEEDKLEAWRYLKGSKREPRVSKETGYSYMYTEGAMAFPDSLNAPARTILTGEGGDLLLGPNTSYKHQTGATAGWFPTSWISCKGFRRAGRTLACPTGTAPSAWGMH